MSREALVEMRFVIHPILFFQQHNRLNKSVENFHIMNIVAKRVGSPGPGYYSNVLVPSNNRSSSPGKAGYSFGKYTKDLDISLRY